jgi:hypothetical protein
MFINIIIIIIISGDTALAVWSVRLQDSRPKIWIDFDTWNGGPGQPKACACTGQRNTSQR